MREELRPGCKVNLGLKITGRRPDGLHELQSLLYPLSSPCDRLFLEKTATREMSLDCLGLDVEPGQNLLFKAWLRFSAVHTPDFGIRATLIKGIPDKAGLGGGSSDAAALLAWLNREHGSPLNGKEMRELAFSVGSDAPFFLEAGPRLVCGAGEELTPVSLRSAGCALLMAAPACGISTAWAFRRYDELAAAGAPRDETLTKPGDSNKEFALSAPAGIVDIADLRFENDLEAAVFSEFPELASLKARLLELGARAASMSGSGSAIYGIFADSLTAKEAKKILARTCPRIFLAEMRDY